MVDANITKGIATSGAHVAVAIHVEPTITAIATIPFHATSVVPVTFFMLQLLTHCLALTFPHAPTQQVLLHLESSCYFQVFLGNRKQRAGTRSPTRATKVTELSPANTCAH